MAKTERFDQVERATIWIEQRLVRLAKATGALTGESAAEVVERLLTKPLEADYRRVTRTVAKDMGDPGA
jgi:hypothetical protein